MVFLVQAARFAVYLIDIGVSMAVDVGPWIRVLVIGNYYCLVGSWEPVMAEET